MKLFTKGPGSLLKILPRLNRRQKASILISPLRSVLRITAVAALAAVVAFTCRTQLNDIVTVPVEGISAEELIETSGDNPVRLALVCSDDEWIEEESLRLAEKISAAYDITPVILSSDEFGEKYSDWNLTVTLGHTEPGVTLFDTRVKLGEDGYEIAPIENEGETVGVNIVAFNAEGARNACNRFIEYFLKGKNDGSKLTDGADSLFVTVRDTEDIYTPVVLKTSGEGGILTVSCSGGDEYSLKALDAIMAETKPALVVFNGGIDCGQSDRTGLSEAWKGIAAILEKYGASFTCAFESDKKLTLSKDLLLETVGSFDNYIDVFSDCETYTRTSVPFTLICLSDEEGNVRAFDLILNGNIFETKQSEAEALEQLKSIFEIIEQSGMSSIPLQVTMAGITSDGADEIYAAGSKIVRYESLGTYILDYADDIYSYLLTVNAKSFQFCCGSVNTGSFANSKGIYFTLGGKLDFTSLGLGGRFELNNSLRGACYTTVSTTGFDVEFIYASDLGAVTK